MQKSIIQRKNQVFSWSSQQIIFMNDTQCYSQYWMKGQTVIKQQYYIVKLVFFILLVFFQVFQVYDQSNWSLLRISLTFYIFFSLFQFLYAKVLIVIWDCLLPVIFCNLNLYFTGIQDFLFFFLYKKMIIFVIIMEMLVGSGVFTLSLYKDRNNRCWLANLSFG